MTGVFSGGLAFEYTNETKGLGIVRINADRSVTELPLFSKLAQALNSNIPQGNGGFKEQQQVSECPKNGTWWQPRNNRLIRTPGVTESYFENGAGTPRGSDFTGKCSQWCGNTSTGYEPEAPPVNTKPVKNNAISLLVVNLPAVAILVVASACL
jgi:hypothetical protein